MEETKRKKGGRNQRMLRKKAYDKKGDEIAESMENKERETATKNKPTDASEEGKRGRNKKKRTGRRNGRGKQETHIRVREGRWEGCPEGVKKEEPPPNSSVLCSFTHSLTHSLTHSVTH
mmetsp:Transcript_4644/g.9336  ORF Transcript_4644/g.9336 Transcript_4644/m.9336 type:complete len:119 (+) Transcript_4644:323-679(+)